MMIAIERSAKAHFLAELIRYVRTTIDAMQAASNNDREIRYLGNADNSLVNAERFLLNAQNEARRECQDDLLSMQLQESVRRKP